MKWEKVKLGEITSSIQTGPFGSQLHQSDYSKEGIPVVMPKDLLNGKISESSIARVSTEYVDRLNRHKIVAGDIIYSRRGDVGRCAYVTNKEQGWLCGTGCLKVTIDSKKADSQFVFFQLQKAETVGWVVNHAVGSTMLNLNTAILSEVPIDLPCLAEQQKIVNILSAYDDLIENNQKQIKLLEEAAQRLYKEWFVDLRFPGHEQVKIVDGVPEGWREQTLGNIADIVMGQSPKSEFYNKDKQGLPFHQGVGTYGKRFVVNDIYSTVFTKIAEAGSILFSVRAPVGRLNLTKDKIAIGRGLSAINHKEGFQSYLFYMLNHRFYKDNIVGNGAIFASISKSELFMQKFIVPNLEIASAFNTKVKTIDEKIDYLDKQVNLLSEARDRLLPKLMSGEIEV